MTPLYLFDTFDTPDLIIIMAGLAEVRKRHKYIVESIIQKISIC